MVRNTPLISIDLIVQNAAKEVLLGWRTNRPAQHTWFVPGGVVRKGETLDAAFGRVLWNELALEPKRDGLRHTSFLGVFEHHYSDNFVSEAGFGTHYVVLAHRLNLVCDVLGGEGFGLDSLPKVQHQQYVWMAVPELLRSPSVHANVKAYFDLEVL